MSFWAGNRPSNLATLDASQNLRHRIFQNTGVVSNSDPCQIITPLVLVGLGLGVGEGLGLGVGLGLGNEISTRGVIIWQGVENGDNTGSALFCLSREKNTLVS